MRFTIYGRNMHVSDNMKDLLKKKFSKFDRYFKEDTDVYATFSTEKHNNIVEVTIPLGRSVLRAEVKDRDIKTAIEKVIDRLEGQLWKHKTKLKRHYRDDFEQFHLDLVDDIPEEETKKVVRTKKFAIKPMSIEEATLQMDMLGHDFFVFLNADTENVNVVYLRKDGNYGLIEPYY